MTDRLSGRKFSHRRGNPATVGVVRSVPDLSMWRPWAGSLLFRGPYPLSNAHTIVIITKYIYTVYLLLYFVKYINLNTKNKFLNFYI